MSEEGEQVDEKQDGLFAVYRYRKLSITIDSSVYQEPLNHVSIALDRELTEVYSFGRKQPDNPFIGGFVKEDIFFHHT